MSKIVLDDTAGGFNISKINANFNKIEDALNNNVLYRDNIEGEPNQMNDLLDMNSQRIINLPAPESANDAARIQDVIDSIHGAQTASTTPFTPNANISATTVQGAIVESDTENRALSNAVSVAISTLISNLILSSNVNNGSGQVGWQGDIDYQANTIGNLLYRVFGRTAAEIAGGITPTNYNYSPGDIRRYGALLNGIAIDTVAWQRAITVASYSVDPATYGSNSPARGIGIVYCPAGYSLIDDELIITKSLAIVGELPTEFSAGSRVVQITTNKDNFKIVPIAQGCSFQTYNISLLSNTSGTGSLVHITRGSSACNSQRYINCVFGTPQSQALFIEAGDDILIQSCLFDVSAASAIRLGTGTNFDCAGNVRVLSCAFFNILGRCILAQNVIGFIAANVHVYSGGSVRTPYFFDGTTLAPFQLRGITIKGGTFGLTSTTPPGITSGVDTLVRAQNIVGLSIEGTYAVNAGKGASASLSFVDLTGVNSEVSIVGNNWTGDFGTKNWYTDNGNAVTNLIISSNNTKINSGTGIPFSVVNSAGRVYGNNCLGHPTQGIGYVFSTTGSVIAPGTINAGTSTPVNITVSGAAIGDKVDFRPTTAAWPWPVGIVVRGCHVSSANTATILLYNPTAGNLATVATDLVLEVSR